MGKPKQNVSRRSNNNTRGERRQSHRDKVINQRVRNQDHQPAYMKRDAAILGAFKPKTEKQRIYASALRANTCVFATGSAGAGKSHVPVAIAAEMYKAHAIKRIIWTKPFFEIDTPLGALPGEVDDKTSWLSRSLRDILDKILGESHVENLFSNGTFEFIPLGTVMGMNFEEAFVIVDEAQNMTPKQMFIMLSRIGEGSKIAVCGDYKMQGFLRGNIDGLQDALRRFSHTPDIAHVNFTIDDCVRSGFCRNVIEAYQDPTADYTC